MGSISGSVKLQFSQKITASRNQFQSPLDLPTSNQTWKKKLAPSLQSPLPTFSRERIIHTIAKCLQLLMLWSSFIIGLLAFCQLVDVFCTPILPICGPVLSLRNFYFGRQRERWKLASYRDTLLTISWYSSISNLYWLSR